MALDQDTINAQLELLAAHRRTLAVYLRQQAELGVLAPPGIINGIAEAQSAIRHIKEQLRADGVRVEDEPNDDVQPAAVAAPSRLSPQEQRNRRAMLTKVKTIWIDGLLEQSLAKELRIALDLTEQPDAVDLPLNALVQELSRPPHPLPPGTPIIQVFVQMGGALLILGAPGAGKTTLLLELARDLIVRAEQDEGHPIPVVFNLSSWAEKRRPLKEWLVEELNTKYDVPRKLAQAWVGADVVLPLLDGLDEVAAEHRASCVEAINAYRLQDAEAMVPLAVCSRVADYEALATKLRLGGAILIQTLYQQQIDTYLVRGGEQLAGVRGALAADQTLLELLDNPLMLSIVTLAYAGKDASELELGGHITERRRHLFAAYIDRMLQHRAVVTSYTYQQKHHRLSWLAARMVDQNQTVYYIEQMQPAWLPPQQQRPYQWYVRLLRALVLALGGGLGGGLVFGLGGGLVFGLVSGLAGELVGVLVGELGEIHSVETLRWSGPSEMSDLVDALGCAVSVGLIFGLIFALVGGLVGGLVFAPDIRLDFFWFGLLFGVLFIVLSFALSGDVVAVRMMPNQGILRSRRSALISGLVGGLVFAPVFGLVLAPVGGLVFAPVFGLVFALIFALGYGGQAVIQHSVLRRMLSQPAA